MAETHSGNFQNEILREEHDGTQNAKRTSLISAATVYAVVNTSATAGQVSVVPAGNMTLFPGPNFIGLVSVAQPLSALVTINPRTDYIGLMSISGNVSFSGNVTVQQITGALPTGANPIGLVTSTLGSAWPNPNTFVGLMTTTIGTPFTSASFFHVIVSAASGQRTQFPSQSARWAIIQGDPGNSTNAYIGASGVSATANGFPLQPGQMTGSEVINLNEMWLANATGSSLTSPFITVKAIGAN